MRTLNNSYTCSQELLYTAGTLGWNLCNQNLTEFANLKPYYTDAYIAAQLQAIEDAKAISPSRKTIGARKQARIDLGNATGTVQHNWQLLKRYIIKAFPKDVMETVLDVAGASLYVKASADKWSSVRSLIDVANLFITDNLDELTAANNMPPDFQIKFENDGVSCTKASTRFFDADMEKQAIVKQKLEANNGIFAIFMEMLKDGQQIFKNDAILREQFVFTQLLAVLKGGGFASFSGFITNDLGLPVKSANIMSTDMKYTATSDAKGYYRIRRIAAGMHTFSITSPGYIAVEQQVFFKTGVASRAGFELKNVMKKVA